MKKSTKLLGRVAVCYEDSRDYRAYSIAVGIKTSYYGRLFFRLGAQANAGSFDRAYSLQLASSLRLDDYEFQEVIAVLSRLQKAMRKESAPRAYNDSEGKAQLANCELAQFTQACEKAGLKVKHFESWREAYNYAERVSECELPAIEQKEAVSA